MKKIISYILAISLMLSGSAVAFADEKEVVIDTEVPVFDNLIDGQTYSEKKDIYIADLSKVDYILLSASTGNAELNGKVFYGYKELQRGTIENCINYIKIASVTTDGSYMIYAVDKYGHDIAVRFKIKLPASDDSGSSSGGGGGGGGGSSKPSSSTGSSLPSITITPSGKTESIVKDILETEEHIVYMTGYPGGIFMPNSNMTRAEVATMFARLMKEKMNTEARYKSSFSDVISDAWYYNYVGYIEKFGIINGYEDGTFRPQNTITRAEFVTMASRFAKINKEYECDFADVSDEHWAYDYIAFAAGNGWIGGYKDNTFKADNTITRAEVVTIVNNMLIRDADNEYVDANRTSLNIFTDVDETHWAYYDIIEATNEHKHNIVEGHEKWNQ